MIIYAYKTEPAKELHVALDLDEAAECQDRAFVPMDVTIKSISRRRWGKPRFKPLIPRVFFFKTPFYSVLPNLPRFATGFIRSVTGEILTIRLSQFEKFETCHHDWLQARLKAFQSHTPPKPRKPISRRWTETSFQEIAKELFGVEIA